MTKLEQAARQALGALEVATTPLAKDRQEVLRAITTLREALSGVQALSAAPAAFLKSVIALCSNRGYSPVSIEAWDKNDKWIADLWRQAEAMLAASPTPPAEQKACDTQLFKFYGVSTTAELIAAQARHIEKLQAKIPPTPSFAPQLVREG